jgi:hypothetical protein
MPHIFYVIGCDVLMILAGVVGPAMFGTNDVAKWLFFIVGCIWFLPILYALAVEWTATAGSAVKPTYKTLAYGTIVVWTAYPFMWLLCEGLGVIPEDTEGESGASSPGFSLARLQHSPIVGCRVHAAASPTLSEQDGLGTPARLGFRRIRPQ